MTGTNGKNKIPKKIILIDNFTQINEIDNLTSDNSTKIITFDYESHQELLEKNIEHEISEIYSDEENVEKIQKNCYEFLEWHNLDIIKKNASFFGINIPKLYADQLIHGIVKILKKFSELKLIFNKYSNSIYFASGDLLLIISLFTELISEIPNGKNEEFYFDKVKLGTKIGKKDLTFSISASSYKNIKNFGEKLLGIRLNKNDKSSGKSTLLVELNTKFFDSFFLESKRLNKNTLYYGRRRPAAWDLKSYNIIKNSDCTIITSDILNNKEFKKYKKEILEIQDFLKTLTNNIELNNFFMVDGISISPVIIPKIKHLLIPRIEKTVFEIILAEQVFKKFLIDSVVVVSEIGMTEQIIIHFANKMKIPVLHLQEGLHYDTLEAFENSKSQGVFLEYAYRYIAWGKFSKENEISFGKVDPEKVVELGSPRFSNLNFKEEENNEEFVLLATMPPQIEEIKGLDVRNLERYLNSVIKICEIVLKQKKKLVIKLHPTSDILSISKHITKKFPTVQVISKGDINPLIRKCSSLIVTGFSTVIIQGQILQKPVISIPLIDYNWGEPSVFKENSCLLINLEQLDKTLEKISTDTIYKNELISNNNSFLTKCFKYRKESSQLIWDYIKNNFH